MSKTEELLRKLRGHLAYKSQVEPYKIFRDIELNLLLDKQPKTLEELGEIKGFPVDGKRYKSYGQSIVDIFCSPDAIDDFEITVDKDGELYSETKLKRMSLFN